MPSKSSSVPENERSEPMVYEVTRMPRSLVSQRAAAAGQVDGMSFDELKKTAAELQIDTAGLTSKEDLAEAVRTSARPSEPAA